MVYLVALPNAMLSSQQGQDCLHVLKLQTLGGVQVLGGTGQPLPGRSGCRSGSAAPARLSPALPGSLTAPQQGKEPAQTLLNSHGGENKGYPAKTGAGAATETRRRGAERTWPAGQPAAGMPSLLTGPMSASKSVLRNVSGKRRHAPRASERADPAGCTDAAGKVRSARGTAGRQGTSGRAAGLCRWRCHPVYTHASRPRTRGARRVRQRHASGVKACPWGAGQRGTSGSGVCGGLPPFCIPRGGSQRAGAAPSGRWGGSGGLRGPCGAIGCTGPWGCGCCAGGQLLYAPRMG